MEKQDQMMMKVSAVTLIWLLVPMPLYIWGILSLYL